MHALQRGRRDQLHQEVCQAMDTAECAGITATATPAQALPFARTKSPALGGAAAARGRVPSPRRRTACGAASPDAAAARQSRPGTDRPGSRPPLRRGGCGHRGPVGALPLQGPWPAAPASPASESPCRFRFWRCRCAAPASARPVGAGSGGARGESRAPARPPADPALSAIRHRLAGHQLRSQEYRLLDIEGPVAPSAKGVAGSVLHQSAVLTPHHFACFHAH